MTQAKKPPKRSDRRSVRIGRAVVSWGPQVYGKPQVIASALVEDIDDLVAVVLQAQAEIRAEDERVPCPQPQCGYPIDPEQGWCPKCLKWTLLPAPDSGLEGI